MITFSIRLADIPIQIEAIHESTKTFCRDYITDESPKIYITMTQADIEDMRKHSEKQNILEGIPVISYGDQYLETLALYRKILEKLLDYNILLFHGSVVVADGDAYLFTAASGTGKTTHCKLWLKNIPGSYILNGDKPLLLFKEDKVYVCGTPWQGKENFGRNEILPLKAICILYRDDTNHIENVNIHDSLEMLLSQSHHDPYGPGLVKAMTLIAKLKQLDLYRLGCNMDDEAALIAYHKMK